MKKHSIKINYLYNLLYQLIVVITPIITTPHLSRVFKPNGIGAISYAESIVTYFILFANAGVTIFGQREISHFQNNISKRSEVFFNVFFIKIVFSSISLFLYIISCVLIFKNIIFFPFVFNILSVLVDITWLYQGLEEFRIIVFRNFIYRFINILFIMVIINDNSQILLYCFSISFFTFLSNLSLWINIPKFVDFKLFAIKFNYQYLIDSALLFLPTIAIQLHSIIDKTMLGTMLDETFENGIYEQATKITRILLTIVTSLVIVASPRIGYLYAINNEEKINDIMKKSYRFTAFISWPMAAGLILVSRNFVPWFLGKEFIGAVALINILSLTILLIGISSITGNQYLIPTHKHNQYTISLFIGLGSNVLLNYFLIPKFLAIGAAASSVISELIIVVSQFIFVKKNISTITIISDSINYIISTIIMFIVVWLLSINFTPSLLNTLIITFTGALIYLILLLLLRDKMLFEFVSFIFNKSIYVFNKNKNN